MILKVSGILLLVSTFFGCASSDEVKEIDTKLDVKGKVDGQDVGLNDDGEAIMQEKTGADDELRAIQWGNTKLLERLETDHYELKRCREDLSDPRLGGSGDVRDIPEIDNMKPVSAVKEEFGLDESGNLSVVKRTKYKERLSDEKKFADTLKKMQKIVEQHRNECERQMRIARVKAGLSAQRYVAEGRFDGNGTWTETRKAEKTLDDAFEIKGKESARGSNN